MHAIAIALLFLNPVLWASFYAISKNALETVDPISFATFELSVAAVPALVILLWLRRSVDRAVLRAGIELGAVLFVAVIGSTIALYFTTATNTAFFPALNGAIAALIMIAVLRRRVAMETLVATGLATFGAVLVIATSTAGGGNPLGDFIALGAAAVYTVYIFVVDRQTGSGRFPSARQLWAVSCVEIVVMAALGWLVLGLYGGSIGGLLDKPEVVEAGLYVGLFTTLAPTVIAVFFQRYVSPMTVALLYVLEPVWGAIAAALVAGEAITPIGYIGGALIVVASLINILSSSRTEELPHGSKVPGEAVRSV